MSALGTERELVSIVIPTYRRPQAVRAAVMSALSQTWRELEILVVADGPDPATRQALLGLDPRLRYLELATNQGPAAARNAGVAATQGQWIAFLDDDDLMLPGRIEAQMRVADPAQRSKMIACRAIYRRGQAQDVWPERPIAEGEDVANYILLRPSLLGRPGIIPIQTLLVHRSVVDAVPFKTHPDHEDWAWLLEVWHRAGARVAFVWEPLVIYNLDTEAVSRSRRLNWSDSLQWAEAYRSWIGDRAFCSFIATKVALKVKRSGNGVALRKLASILLRNGAGPLELAFFAGVLLLPRIALQSAWKRSLRSEGTLGPQTNLLKLRT